MMMLPAASSFLENSVRPNTPLRRPSTRPNVSAPADLGPVKSLGLTLMHMDPAQQPLATNTGHAASGTTGGGDAAIGCGNHSAAGPTPPPLTVHLCGYCGQQGNFRCVRCKKRYYCSVLCQTEDWKAHRHMCTATAPSVDIGKLEGAGSGPSQLTSKMPSSAVVSSQKVYLRDLKKVGATKGANMQAAVVEMYSPSRFFLHSQEPEQMMILNAMAVDLQMTYSGSTSVAGYIPDVGEVCGVKFSLDLKWYRGVVQSVATNQMSANILYIDYGNEEEVPFHLIRPLFSTFQSIPPSAMECYVAGVKPVNQGWDEECLVAVKQLVTGKSLTVTIVDTPKIGHLYAVDIDLPFIGTQLSSFVLEHGYATREDMLKKLSGPDIDSVVNASLENFRCLSPGKDVNMGAQAPEPPTQGLGDTFSAVVTHLQSPDDFICQKVENASLIEDLQRKLKEHCSQLPVNCNFRPAPGTVCCSQFSEDSQWYRAKVLGYSSEERVCVGYIDFGNSEEVELSQLRPLSASLLSLPSQAIPCALAGVRPVAEAWPQDVTLQLRQMVSNRILHMEIVGEQRGAALVAMHDTSSDPQISIAKLLVAGGYAAPDAVSHQVEQIATTAEEAQACRRVDQALEWSCSELPRDGQTVALTTCVVNNPGEFYCYISSQQDMQNLAKLTAELAQHCEADSSPFKARVGEPCCAKFPGDGSWYRAMVQGLFEKEASIYFVDYGNSSQVEVAQLRAITPQLLSLPFQAVRCWLTGVEPVGPCWSSVALQLFGALVQQQELQARVVSVTEQGYGLEMQRAGQDVAGTLISQKVAQAPRQPPQADALEQQQQHATRGPVGGEQPEAQSQVQTQVPVPREAVEEAATTGPAVQAAPSGAASYPVDWTTEQLPLNQAFQPRTTAVVNPSLFYLLSPSQVDPEKLLQMKMELSEYCSTNQALNASSSPAERPAVGAACCALFSGDKNWYRGVVLETSEEGANVVYADYGNTEKVPYSSILPIPSYLLQLPFQITRCALDGQEQFPSVWPSEVLDLFQMLLSEDILAEVSAFDGSANLLSLAKTSQIGVVYLNAIVWEELENRTKMAAAPAPSPESRCAETNGAAVTTPRNAAAVTTPKNAAAVTTTKNTAAVTTPRITAAVTTTKSTADVTTLKNTAAVPTTKITAAVPTTKITAAVTTLKNTAAVTTTKMTAAVTTLRNTAAFSTWTNTVAPKQPTSSPAPEKPNQQHCTAAVPASTKAVEPAVQHKPKGAVLDNAVQKVVDQMEPTLGVDATTATNCPQTSGCCCLELKTKIDHLEELLQSLLKQMS